MRKEVRLSIALSPHLSVPLRYFLTAPIFALIAAIVLLVAGPAVIDSRWNTAILAATHFLTLGYITMVIIGALFQLLPVLLGSPVPRASSLGKLIHVCLSAGVLLLTSGFLFDYNWMMVAAMIGLSIAFSLFLIVAILSLVRAPVRAEYVTKGLIFSVACLLETVVFGISLAGQRAGIIAESWSDSWADVHLALGLVGWGSLTLVSVAYVVVPMFQLTRDYPRFIIRWLQYVLIIFLVFWASLHMSATTVIANTLLFESVFSTIIATSLAAFAIITLRLQYFRRIVAWDVTVYFWRMAMLFLLGSCLLWIVSRYIPQIYNWPGLPVLLGLLFIIGFLVTAINGMLYKIVPFLVWYHLQYANHQLIKLPKMHQIIPATHTRSQYYVLVCANSTLVLAVLYPVWWLYYPGLLMFMCSSALLLYNLMCAMRHYQTTFRHLMQLERNQEQQQN